MSRPISVPWLTYKPSGTTAGQGSANVTLPSTPPHLRMRDISRNKKAKSTGKNRHDKCLPSPQTSVSLSRSLASTTGGRSAAPRILTYDDNYVLVMIAKQLQTAERDPLISHCYIPLSQQTRANIRLARLSPTSSESRGCLTEELTNTVKISRMVSSNRCCISINIT